MPIRSREDYLAYLAADLAAHHCQRWSLLEGWRNPVLGFQRLLRRAEYVANCKPGPLWRFRLLWLKWRLRRRSFLLGFNIPINVFGPGLCIVHWGNVIVNWQTRIGANCRIHPGVCIGELDGATPTIGDGAYLGPGAKIYGSVVLGDNVRVGANAVVNKSFPSNSTLVGVPARAVEKAAAPAAAPPPPSTPADRN